MGSSKDVPLSNPSERYEMAKCAVCKKQFVRIPGNTWDNVCYKCRKRADEFANRVLMIVAAKNMGLSSNGLG